MLNNAEPDALLLVSVVVPALFARVIAPETVRADVALFSVIPVTLAPTPAEIRTDPLPDPEFVIVPVLFRRTRKCDTIISAAIII